MSLLPVGFGASGDDYEITDSLRIRNSASASLQRFNATETNRRTFTYSGWFKLGSLNNDLWFQCARYNTSNFTGITINVNQGFGIYQKDSGNITFVVREAGEKRDYAAWYHFVAAVDTTQSTSTNRVKLYVNGVLSTSLVSAGYPSQNLDTFFNTTTAVQTFAQSATTGNAQWDGYVTETHFIDGQQLTADDFGEFDANGTWKAKEYTGTHGTNGFYLPMKPTTQAELQNTVLYAGNTDKQSIDGVGYAPDLVWIKNRTGANNHYLYDTVRGTDRSLLTNATNADNVGAQQLTSFDTDGFTVPYDVSGYNNYAGRSYVAWTWDAGDNQTSTGISSVLYVGQGVAQSVKGFGFSPDLIIFKNRAAASPLLIDSVRGPFLELQTNSTGAETSNNGTRIASIDADGFSFADTAVGGLNQQNNNYIAWGWDAGDGDPVSNTDGDINSTVKANTATGFSIATATTGSSYGSFPFTIGHGLGTAPAMVIYKSRSTAGQNWWVWHKDLPNAATGRGILLNSAGGEINGGYFASNPATSTTMGINAAALINDNIVMYSFAEVSGVSKFGSYTGTGSTDGPTITTGFRPGFLLIKNATATESWQLLDSTRSPFNNVDDVLFPNSSSAEATTSAVTTEFLSDGFKIRAASGNTNDSGQTYIYMAFKGSYSDYVSPLNDTGTIDSRVKANPSKGFSIVSYTGNATAGATVGHGLSAAPEMIITKNRSAVSEWTTFVQAANSGNGQLGNLRLNRTNAWEDSAIMWNDTSPTSTVFSLGSYSHVNGNGNNLIAYCFNSVAGYSKIDSYTGTGSAGNSVTTGFRPAWLMIKRTDSAGGWCIHDNTRNPNNPRDLLIRADTSSAETTGGNTQTDFTSNGFTLQTTNTDMNANGGTYIYMAFAETADAVFNFDASGNKNNFDANNINSNADSETTYDLMKDTPSLVDENAANFATLNPLYENSITTLSEGNLKGSGTAGAQEIATIIADGTSNFYYEIDIVARSSWMVVGLASVPVSGGLSGLTHPLSDVRFYRYALHSGATYNGGTYTSSGGFTATAGDVIGIHYNNGTMTPYKNGIVQTPTMSLPTTSGVVPSIGADNASTTFVVNFGQRPFAYTPPAGSLKLNTFNLPDSTIEDGSDYFNTVLYTGDGTSSNAITGVGFQPDLVIGKGRTYAGSGLVWYDSVRGATKWIGTYTTAAEATVTGVTSFDADGFSVGSSAVQNLNASPYVAWNWKANGSGVSNTDGSITSTVSANTTAGFSIVSFAAQSGTYTVGHGLNSPPEIILGKNRNINGGLWYTQTTLIDGTVDYLSLNSTAAAADAQGFGFVAPTSTVFTGDSDLYYTTGNMITYCFHSVEGYSSMGKYTGNGSTDGPFVYTGFRPAFVMVKVTAGAIYDANWFMLDSARGTYNVNKPFLAANNANAENSGATCADFLSNGFKLRITNSLNDSNATYIYMAFAENPFKNANAR